MPATTEDATTVTGIGYDSESRRLELQLDTGLILAYRNVGPDVHRALLVRAGAIDAPDWQRAQTYWTPERVRSRPAYQYRNLDEADSAGQRRTAPALRRLRAIHRRRAHLPGSSRHREPRAGNSPRLSATATPRPSR